MEIEDLVRIELEADDKLAERMQGALRQIAIGAVYGLSCTMLGAEQWKAISIGALIWGCLALGLARHAIMRAGLVFIPYAMLFWIGIAPAPGGIFAWVCR